MVRKVIGTKINDQGQRVKVVRVKKKKGQLKSQKESETMILNEMKEISNIKSSLEEQNIAERR